MEKSLIFTCQKLPLEIALFSQNWPRKLPCASQVGGATRSSTSFCCPLLQDPGCRDLSWPRPPVLPQNKDRGPSSRVLGHLEVIIGHWYIKAFSLPPLPLPLSRASPPSPLSTSFFLTFFLVLFFIFYRNQYSLVIFFIWMLWIFFCASYFSDCPCSVSFGVWPTRSWIVEAPLFSLHVSSLPYSFRRCHLSPPESMFLSETHVQLPNVRHHWVVPLTPQVQGALNWTYFLQAPGLFLMLDLHAMSYCFLFLNPPTVRGCFPLTLLTVSSLGQDPTSVTCISLLTGLSPAILTAPMFSMEPPRSLCKNCKRGYFCN